MAGTGGAKPPDFRPRLGGVGAQAQRMDLTDGRGLGVKSNPVTGAPSPGVAPSGQGYGQRKELTDLAAGAPTRPPSRASASSGPGGQLPTGPDMAEEEYTEPLPMPPPVAPEILAATDPDELESILPLLWQVAAQVDGSPALQALFDLAGEQVLHMQAQRQPMPMSLDPDPDYADEGL